MLMLLDNDRLANGGMLSIKMIQCFGMDDFLLYSAFDKLAFWKDTETKVL